MRYGSLRGSLLAIAAASALVGSSGFQQPFLENPRGQRRGKASPKSQKPRRFKPERNELREQMKAIEREKAEAAIPDKYLHAAERRRRQAAHSLIEKDTTE